MENERRVNRCDLRPDGFSAASGPMGMVPQDYQLFLINASKAKPPLGSRVALTATRGVS